MLRRLFQFAVQISLAAAMALSAGCTAFPDLTGAISAEAANAPYPTLLPAGSVAVAETDFSANAAAINALKAESAALSAAAAAIGANGAASGGDGLLTP